VVDRLIRMSNVPRWLLVTLVSFALALAAWGLISYRVQRSESVRKVESELSAVASSKAREILEWRQERLRDALVLSESPELVRAVREWQGKLDDEASDEILNLFRTFQRHFSPGEVALVDPAGTVRVSLTGRQDAGGTATRTAIETAIGNLKPAFVDLFEDESGAVLLGVVAPVPSPSVEADQAPTSLAAVVVLWEARQYLYPLLASWPRASRTAEILLVRRDGDSVLMLSPSRHREDFAFRFRLPLSREEAPAVQGILGREGPFSGRDYRGVEVFSHVVPIPDTPWWQVAKIDADEAMATFREEIFLTLGLLAFVIGFGWVLLLFLWQRSLKEHYRSLLQVETENRRVEARYRTTLMSVGDAVIAADIEGRVEMMNRAAEQLTGWTQSEATGKPLPDVFKITHEITGEVLESPIQRVIREGTVAGLISGTLLAARNGVQYPILATAAPIHDEPGVCSGVVLVFRDQTEARKAAFERSMLADLLAASFNEIYLFDPQTLGFRIVNQGALENLGYTTEEIHGMTPLDLQPGLSRQAYADLLDPLLRGKKRVQVFETLQRRADGTNYPVEVYLQLFRHEDEEVGMAVVIDVSERKRHEAALRQSEENYRQLFELESDAIVLIDNETGRMIEANEAATALYGFSREELLQMTNRDLSAEPEATRAATHAEPVVPGTVVRIPLRWHRKRDGTVFPVEITARFYIRDGRSVHVASIRDITERRRAEEALRESEARFRQVAESLDEVVWLGAPDWGEIFYISPAYERIWGRSREELYRRPMAWLDGIVEEDRSAILAAIPKKASSGEVFEFPDYRVRHSDGTERWISARAFPVVDEQGLVVRIAGVAEDITARKRAEREKDELQAQLLQSQKMESVGRLAGGVAHDFNNNLQTILGYVDIALETIGPDDPVRESILEIRRAGLRSADLTRQLLGFARRQTIRPEVIDLNDAVSGTLRMLSRLIGEHIDLTWVPGHGVWQVKIDASQLDQILANLAVNARDAISGSGKIEIRTDNFVLDADACRGSRYCGCAPGEYVRLMFSDNGCGMDAETMAAIFEPFFTTKEVGQGTGLGLATVYGIVRQNRGFIYAESRPKQGSTFTIGIPRAARESYEKIRTPDSKGLPRGSETVLVVEDEKSILTVGRSLLERLGYTVLSADTPAQALRTAGEYPSRIDLLLTDVVMPEMDGKELAAKVMELRPNVKCLFMSGYTSDIIGERGILDAGVNFIKKPFSFGELASTVRKVLQVEEAKTEASENGS